MGGGEKMTGGEGIGEIGEVVLLDICHLLCLGLWKRRYDIMFGI